MSDLVERITPLLPRLADPEELRLQDMPATADLVTLAPALAARITELETALAEAEERVKDQIVNAIKTRPNFGDEDFGPGLDLAIDIATAGEWKK